MLIAEYRLQIAKCKLDPYLFYLLKSCKADES
jgi:hypothetical protein